jgi:hypothetical protein
MTFAWEPLPRSVRVLAAFMAVTGVAGVAVVRAMPFTQTLVLGLPSFCTLKLLFGIPCLACRGTRAAFALAHGDIGRALFFNPMATLLVIGLLAGSILGAATGKVPFLHGISRPWSLLLWCLLAAALLGNWAYVIRAGG